MTIQIFRFNRFVCAAFVVLLSVAPRPAASQSLTSVSPASQTVHEFIDLQGSNFGTTQGSSQVLFTDGIDTWDAGTAYLWRDNYIRIRVPVGKLNGATIVPIAKGPLQVFVQTGAGPSATRSFQVITSATNAVTFRQLTSIVSHGDTSAVLGFPNMNSARTKDAEVADVNGDGWPDIIDNNSNNVQNNSHTALRLSNQDKTFTAIAFEPLDSADSGSFATEIPSGGDFFEDHTSYDSDFADINNDRLPDLLQTAANNSGGGSAHRIRILVNNRGGVPAQFIEDTAARLPAAAFGAVGCPDDVDHIDMDGDGDVDFLTTMRTATGFCSGDTSEIRVFSNTGSGVFATPIVINARTNNSTHDAFFFDANNDGLYDIVAANEWNNDTNNTDDVRVELFLNDGAGGFTLNRTFNLAGTSGGPADFNGDGLMDFVVGRTAVKVFLTRANSACFTNPANACEYDEVDLLTATGNNPFYDLEVGDIDADGFPDVVGARILPTADNVPVWINDGDGTFTEITGGNAASILPGHTGDYQRLSADLLDMDLDGDLDLYVTGQDGNDNAPSGVGFGRGPNQLFENLLFGLDIVNPRQSLPAYAGSATGGRKVLVRLRADAPVAGLGPGDFVVTVDSTALAASAIVTGAQIEAEYWLLVQMPAKPNGCYPLEVALAADPALSDLENNSLCYDDERLFDRAVAIDRTTSMLYNSVTDVFDTEKIDAAHAAANFFVNLTEDDDLIAVTSFQRNADDGDGVIDQDEMARTDWAMTPGFDSGTMTDNRDLAVGVVNGIQPDGTYFPYQTTIGAGLMESWTELQDEGDAGHEWEIVLLSDGIENLAPFWSRVEAGPPEILPIKPDILAADPRVTVHTVAIGQDADVVPLMDIADSTGGLFFNLYEGTGSFGLISRLSSVYKYIDEEMRDEQRFFYREGVPSLVTYTEAGFGEVSTALTHGRKRIRIASFYVPTDFESITVGFHWDRNNAIEQVLLYDPALSPIAPAPPVRTIQTNPKHKIYRIRDPQPGWYHYVVEVETNSPFEFYAVASGISDVIVKGRVGTVNETSPGHHEVPIRIVSGDFDPILWANISGEVVLPDKTHIPITLHDDGSHEDGGNADGIYGQMFAHTMAGPYTVELETTGISNRNEPFSRYTIMSFNFPGREPDVTKPEKPPGRGIPCPPCAWLWLILTLFALILSWLIWQWYQCCYRLRVQPQTTGVT
jgi:hypothetical protein